MSFDPISAAFDLGKVAIEKLWPDPVKRAEEIRKLEEVRQRGDLAELNAHVELMTGQLRVNEAEAKHQSLFVAGWRPFVGWVGGFALAYQFLLYPLLMWAWSIALVYEAIPAGVTPPPVFESEVLYTLISGMLGIGGMRSYDKLKGNNTHKVGKK